MANIFKAKTLVGRTGIFSHEVIAPNLVHNSGNQIISGNKTFVNNLEIQGTGIFNSVDLSNISEFQFSGVGINLVNSIINLSGEIFISGNQVLTGIKNHAFTHSATGLDPLTPTDISGIWQFTVLSPQLVDGSTTGINASRNLLYNFSYGGNNITTIRLPDSGNLYGDQISITWAGGPATGILPIQRFLNNQWETIDTITTKEDKYSYNYFNGWFKKTVDTHAHNNYYLISNPSGFITQVDLSPYATITNLTNTGSTLQTNINTLTTNLINTGSNLKSQIDSMSGALDLSGSNLNNRITSLSGAAVLRFGDQTISGNKTFVNTGSFNAIQISNRLLSSYSYNSTNFIFGDSYLNFVNSSNNITGTLPSGIVSGINYYVKNLNTGILLITGSGQRTIDGFPNLNLYINESAQLIGINNIGYTGWVTISTNQGIS